MMLSRLRHGPEEFHGKRLMNCSLRKEGLKKARAKRVADSRPALFALCLLVIALQVLTPVKTAAQLLKKSDYGAGITFAIYQFDDVKSKPADQSGNQMVLKQ